MDTSNLEKLGLSRNESIAYLSLLKLGSTSAQNLIKESGLHRSRVYDSLERLEQLGLVSSVVKDYKKYFQAAKPEKLFDYVNEKKEIVNRLLPELKKLEGMKKEEITASVYKGLEGLKTIHAEMLKEGEDVYVLGAKGFVFTEMPYYMPNFEKERIKRGIKFWLLYDNSLVKQREQINGKRQSYEGKVMPSEFASNAVAHIFGSKTAIFLWKQKYPTAFMINNMDVADAFRKWFKLIYQNLD